MFLTFSDHTITVQNQSKNQNQVYCQVGFHIQEFCFCILEHNNKHGESTDKEKRNAVKVKSHKYKIETFTARRALRERKSPPRPNALSPCVE